MKVFDEREYKEELRKKSLKESLENRLYCLNENEDRQALLGSFVRFMYKDGYRHPLRIRHKINGTYENMVVFSAEEALEYLLSLYRGMGTFKWKTSKEAVFLCSDGANFYLHPLSYQWAQKFIGTQKTLFLLGRHCRKLIDSKDVSE